MQAGRIGVEADEQDIRSPAGRADYRAAVSGAQVQGDRRVASRETAELADVDLGDLPAAEHAHVA